MSCALLYTMTQSQAKLLLEMLALQENTNKSMKIILFYAIHPTVFDIQFKLHCKLYTASKFKQSKLQLSKATELTDVGTSYWYSQLILSLICCIYMIDYTRNTHARYISLMQMLYRISLPRLVAVEQGQRLEVCSSRVRKCSTYKPCGIAIYHMRPPDHTIKM